MNFNFKIWIRVATINLLIVALLGVLMRYKIGFEFPFFNQKNIQHAHSHFAFGGWISLMIMVLMLYSVKDKIPQSTLKPFHVIFIANVIAAYGMLISFAIEGYAFFSITFSTLSIFFSFWFCYYFYQSIKSVPDLPGIKWMKLAMLLNVLSTLGTFSLSYMMATHQVEQHTYLAAVYWYLHFQYNGWFFFACIGLLMNYLFSHEIHLKQEKQIFKIFAFACVPAYGLSILWLNLPLWIYIIVVLAAIAQVCGLFILLKQLYRNIQVKKIHLDIVSKLLLLCVVVAISIKIILQAGSTVPAISQFAFGFRPIVIAYLHLVLLAFTSVFLIAFAYLNQLFCDAKAVKVALIIFVLGIILNELILAVQGIFSISYTMVPYANIMLFMVALLMLLGLTILNISLIRKRKLD